jgi:hypothetical protein
MRTVPFRKAERKWDMNDYKSSRMLLLPLSTEGSEIRTFYFLALSDSLQTASGTERELATIIIIIIIQAAGVGGRGIEGSVL